jgi:predicted CopG family antitoxin
MATRTITLDEEAYRAVERAAQASNQSIAEFVLQAAKLRQLSFDELLAPIRTPTNHLTEDELDTLSRKVRDEVNPPPR